MPDPKKAELVYLSDDEAESHLPTDGHDWWREAARLLLAEIQRCGPRTFAELRAVRLPALPDGAAARPAFLGSEAISHCLASEDLMRAGGDPPRFTCAGVPATTVPPRAPAAVTPIQKTAEPAERAERRQLAVVPSPPPPPMPSPAPLPPQPPEQPPAAAPEPAPERTESMNEHEWISRDEAAKLWGITSASGVSYIVGSQKLRTKKIGTSVMLMRADVDRVAAARRSGAVPARKDAPAELPDAPAPGGPIAMIRWYVEGVDMRALTAEEAIRRIAELVRR